MARVIPVRTPDGPGIQYTNDAGEADTVTMTKSDALAFAKGLTEAVIADLVELGY